MSRPFWQRLLLALWGLWFVAALSEVAPLGACPLHGQHGLFSGAVHGAGHMSHAAHAAHGMSDASNRTSGHSHDSHATCSCIGLCCTAPSLVPPGSAAIITAGVVRSLGTPRWAALTVVAARAPPHSHPFATAPPVAPALSL